jgi:hypothetical protein
MVAVVKSKIQAFGPLHLVLWLQAASHKIAMAANIDFSRIPGKKGDPYRGQAVLRPEEEEEHGFKLPAIPVSGLLLKRPVKPSISIFLN